jgi:hypothetical protein
LQTEESERRSPTVRIDYDEAFAVCGIGEGLAATKSKHWGSGPRILPLRPDDPVDPVRILYVFKEGSRYNLRFLQRQKLKKLLGKRYRPLVTMAKGFTQTVFLEQLTAQQAYVIRQLLHMQPVEFWRASKGKSLIELPDDPGQLDRQVLAGMKEKPKQLLLEFGSPRTHEYIDEEHRTDE